MTENKRDTFWFWVSALAFGVMLSMPMSLWRIEARLAAMHEGSHRIRDASPVTPIESEVQP